VGGVGGGENCWDRDSSSSSVGDLGECMVAEYLLDAWATIQAI